VDGVTKLIVGLSNYMLGCADVILDARRPA
jgi:hypothetical protein